MKLPKYRAWDYNDKKMWKVVAMSESIYGDVQVIQRFDGYTYRKEGAELA